MHFSTPIFLVVSLASLLVQATRGLNPMFGPESKNWMEYKSGVFYGQYQVAKDLTPKEMATFLGWVADDLMTMLKQPSKYAPGLQNVPYAVSAYMGNKGVLAVAASGNNKHAEENVQSILGSKFKGGESLAYLLPGGNNNDKGTIMGACRDRCTPLLAKHGVTDVFPQAKAKRSHARDTALTEA